jgi:hypothetical protein
MRAEDGSELRIRVGAVGGGSTPCWHEYLEAQLAVRFRELARQAVQDHLDLRTQREELSAEVVDADGVARARVEVGRERGLVTIFAEGAPGARQVRAVQRRQPRP